MKSASTGTGLCVLGGCILASTALTTSNHESAANAAGSTRAGASARTNSAPTPQSPPMLPPDLAQFPGGLPPDQAIGLRGRIGGITQLSADSACLGAPAYWFDSTPHLFDHNCGRIYPVSLSSADINGDGSPESFAWLISQWGANKIWDRTSDAPLPLADAIACVHYETSTSGAIMRGFPVFASDTRWGTLVRNYLREDPMYARYTRCEIFGYADGFLDCDGDGDMDLVMNHWATLETEDGFTASAYMFLPIWFENTGNQRVPPANPFDLDQNGNVNTADLSLLLLNFD